jgi:hypothetical protein
MFGNQFLTHETEVFVDGEVGRGLQANLMGEISLELRVCPRELHDLLLCGGKREARVLLLRFYCLGHPRARKQILMKLSLEFQNVEDLRACVLTQGQGADLQTVQNGELWTVPDCVELPDRKAADRIALKMEDSEIAQFGQRLEITDIVQAVVVHQQLREKSELPNIPQARDRIIGQIERQAVGLLLRQQIDPLDVVARRAKHMGLARRLQVGTKRHYPDV